MQSTSVRDEVLEVLARLVAVDSANPPGNELLMAREVAALFEERRIPYEIDAFGDGRANITGRVPGRGPEPRALIFNGHLDTVPPGTASWQRPPWTVAIEDDHVYGLGTSDMKGGLATMIVAAGRLVADGAVLEDDLVLAFTAGEEMDSIGAWRYAHLIDPARVLGVVVGEPTDNRIMTVEKGALWLRVSVYGKTAHGAWPHLGHNAIMGLNAFVNELMTTPFDHRPHEQLGSCTVSVNTISGGMKTNVVPDMCEATIDIRTVPGQDHRRIATAVGDLLLRVLPASSGFTGTVEVVNDRPSVSTSPEHPFVHKAWSVLVQAGGPLQCDGFWGYTDASVFGSLHPEIPFIICGPGRADSCHQPDEYARCSDLVLSVGIYQELALRCLAPTYR